MPTVHATAAISEIAQLCKCLYCIYTWFNNHTTGEYGLVSYTLVLLPLVFHICEPLRVNQNFLHPRHCCDWFQSQKLYKLSI